VPGRRRQRLRRGTVGLSLRRHGSQPSRPDRRHG
jgi:hypothetical protein